MTDKTPAKPEGTGTVLPRRHPGHRGQDVRDAVAEMAAKAAEISMEAGSKMAAAMKDVINAAAGLTGFAIESARDVVQFMVRRGQMTQDEADKLLHGVEEAWSKKHQAAAEGGGARGQGGRRRQAGAPRSGTQAGARSGTQAGSACGAQAGRQEGPSQEGCSSQEGAGQEGPRQESSRQESPGQEACAKEVAPGGFHARR
ncbi:MAG: hypothetical protein ACYC1W_07575, partial [Gemmatimonadaceae bacterium]